MLKISYVDCSGLSPAIVVHFIFEMRVVAQNREKFIGFKVIQGHRC